MSDGDAPKATKNTDRELYREPTERIGCEYYMPSIHVTEGGGIGIDVGGYVMVRPLREWHAAMKLAQRLLDVKVTHYAFGRMPAEQIGEVACLALRDYRAAVQRGTDNANQDLNDE